MLPVDSSSCWSGGADDIVVSRGVKREPLVETKPLLPRTGHALHPVLFVCRAAQSDLNGVGLRACALESGPEPRRFSVFLT